MASEKQRKPEEGITKKTFGFQISSSDFGGNMEQTKKFFTTINGIEALSVFIKDAVIEKVKRVESQTESDYRELMEYLNFNGITFKDAIEGLRGKVDVDSIKKEVKTEILESLIPLIMSTRTVVAQPLENAASAITQDTADIEFEDEDSISEDDDFDLPDL